MTEVGGLASWRGPEVAESDDWKHEFDSGELDDLLSTVRGLAGRATGEGSAWLKQLSCDDAPLHSLQPKLSLIREQLMNGRGFSLIRGLPVHDLTMTENELMFWVIGLHLGVPIHQDPQGTLIIHVLDQGKDFDQPGVRAYETSARLEYHTDSSDIVGLYCIRPAMRGGTSTIVSSVAVHDAMVRSRPELAALLYQPWGHVSVVGDGASFREICARNSAGQLFTRYGRKYLEIAPQRSPEVPPLTPEQIEALDLFDDYANSPNFYLNIDFQPGDVQLLNNYVIMHARTDYEDWPEPGRHRELLRLWLVVTDGLDLPETFADSGIISRRVAFQK
jgi:hypothetical protein